MPKILLTIYTKISYRTMKRKKFTREKTLGLQEKNLGIYYDFKALLVCTDRTRFILF